jgi:hypothetical protein
VLLVLVAVDDFYDGPGQQRNGSGEQEAPHDEKQDQSDATMNNVAVKISIKNSNDNEKQTKSS